MPSLGGWTMKILIAYYSRTGVTQLAAEAIVAALMEMRDVEVTLEEIVDTRSRQGALGYLSAGRDASLKRQTVIATPDQDPSQFDLLIVGTPVWAFTLATAMRTYCTEYGCKAPKAAVFCTMGGAGDERTFAHAEKLLAKAPVATLTLIDKRVREADEQEFLAKVKRFAEEIASQ